MIYLDSTLEGIALYRSVRKCHHVFLTIYLIFIPGITTFVTLKIRPRLGLWIENNKSTLNFKPSPLDRPGCELYNDLWVCYGISNIQVDVSLLS
jgi:hypothetical protein